MITAAINNTVGMHSGLLDGGEDGEHLGVDFVPMYEIYVTQDRILFAAESSDGAFTLV